MPSSSDLQSTVNLQQLASDPQVSVFVAASAGSGKTKILTDRVLRLLLSGVMPAKILCLTFTKVAAAEMQRRINEELMLWVTLSDEQLKNRLLALTGLDVSDQQIVKAKKLFAVLLDDNSGLQISTIHAFCQSIIKKFPIEAKTSPKFEIITAEKENQLLLQARKLVLQEALFNKELARYINLITNQLNENSFLEITAELIKQRHNLAELKEQYFDIASVIQAIYQKLKVDPSEDESSAFSQFVNDKNWQKSALFKLCQTAEIKNKEVIIDFISNPQLENLSQYLAVFLTDKNEPRKKLVLKEVLKSHPEADQLMLLEQNRIVEFLEKFNNVKIANSTAALLVVVDKIIDTYDQLKAQNAYLDYDDLIIKTNQLLQNSANREWIKYKLDGSYSHILVDEAQDTNHHQWNIIKVIAEEFFAGLGSDSITDAVRTIFVVGDEKQSIYSFQGADPNIFANIFYYYQEKLKGINQKILNIELSASFRSLPAVLKLVDAVFADEKRRQSISVLAKEIQHYPIKADYFGRVEVWPIIQKSIIDKKKTDDKYQWSFDFEVNDEYQSQELLAKIIVRTIKKWFLDKKILLGKKRPVQYGDIMILLKERKSNLGNLLIKYFHQEQIPVSGRDKIRLLNDIIGQDLLSVAKFILLPEDDLNLAALLKAPMLGLDDQNLLELCNKKNQAQINLFAALKDSVQYQAQYQYLLDLLNQYNSKQLSIHQLFSYLLIKKQAREAILSRFGAEADEIISQFLELCLNYQENNLIALQNFVQVMESSDAEIKIDLNSSGQNQVRITTIHSAKGLEAPIVFLADTAHSAQKQIGQNRKKVFWQDDLPFWSTGKNDDNDLIRDIKAAEKLATKKEYLRQLYVAMTRAEEELYITGFGKDLADDCWYNVIKGAIVNQAQAQHFDFNQLLNDEKYLDNLAGEGLVLEDKQLAAKDFDIKIADEVLTSDPAIDDIKFLTANPTQESVQELAYPSQLHQQDAANSVNKYQAELGTIIHKILELDLKNSNQQQRIESITKYLIMHYSLSLDQQQRIIESATSIFDNPELVYLFADNSYAEVPIMAKIDGKLVSGKIDRLIVSENQVLIIDYKTGKHNAEHYEQQLQLYQKILQQIYPQKSVGYKIIWVE